MTSATAAAAAAPRALYPPPVRSAALLNNDVAFSHKIVYSGISGAIATTCIYPLDFTKTKLQAQKGATGSAAREFAGPIDVVRKVWTREGIRGLYKGWPPNVVLVMPEKALKLTMNDFFRARIRQMRPKHDLPFQWEMVAGGLAGFTQVIATNPMELLKIQGATVAEKIKAGLLKEPPPYSLLIRQLGFTGLYTGVLSTLARDVPFSMLYFSGYAATLRALMGDQPQQGMGVKPFLAGALAGTAAAAVTTPIDVIKTRVHANATPMRLSPLAYLRQERHLLVSTTRAVVREEGYGALCKGLAPRCLIISPLFAITMMCYEKFQQTFH